MKEQTLYQTTKSPEAIHTIFENHIIHGGEPDYENMRKCLLFHGKVTSTIYS